MGTARALATARIIERPTEEQIAIVAYEMWEARGCPHGSSDEDWFAAEARLASPATAEDTEN